MENKKISVFWITGIFIFFEAAIACAQTDPGDMIVGYWMDPKRETIVHCFKQNGKYFGRLVWVENTEAKGQPLSASDRFLINYIVLKDFEYKNNEWVNGIIYQPKTNKTYTAYLKLIDNDTMDVTGFVFFRFLSESQVFTRIASTDAAALKLQSVVD